VPCQPKGGIRGKDRKEVSHLVSLEDLKAEPDQLLSYFLWVEDVGPDGKVRRNQGDMFFAEVRPFEAVFRQGQQPAQGEQEQRQRQQQAQQSGQNAQRAEQVAEAQKNAINAAWKVLRRETANPTAQKLSDTFAPDVKLIEEAQTAVRTQAESMQERVTDDRSSTFLQSAMKNMEKAAQSYKDAQSQPSAQPLKDAIAAGTKAYEDLLKLRARENEVVRQNRQQQQGQQSQAQQRQQRQLDQLDLENQENP